MTTQTQARGFYGWRVVAAAFVMAAFGWGIGFYGPPVFLSVVRETRGWPVALISAAVTLHFLVGAVVGGVAGAVVGVDHPAHALCGPQPRTRRPAR